MATYTFEAELEVSGAFDINSNNKVSLHSKTLVAITFEYFFENDYDNWHNRSFGQLKILNLTNTQFNHSFHADNLPLETQLLIRGLCCRYIELNHLNPYENIIPIYSYPIRAGGYKTDQRETPAKIISFPAKNL